MTHLTRLFLLVTCVCASACVYAEEWQVIEPGSRIGFVATYDDIPFDAVFESFDARIRFSPDSLDTASFDVRIDVPSVDSDSRDRDEGMQGPEWLAAGDHPTARFQADRFERLSGNRYRAIGELSLKGVSKTIEVPFTWEPEASGKVLLTAETRLQRGDFDIGSGEWAEDDTIGFDVTVRARLKLRRQ